MPGKQIDNELSRVVMKSIRVLRKVRGWSAEELSSRLGAIGKPIPRICITNWENGRRQHVTVDELHALATVFDLKDPCELITPPCERCSGLPPIGFQCMACGREASA